MTSLICWVAVDTHGPTSVYLASDSRLSWSMQENWDIGRKLFASRTQVDIFGYCGDVVFPSQKLGQLIDRLDSGLLYDKTTPVDSKHEKAFCSIKTSFGKLPNTQKKDFTIVHCTRNGENMKSVFSIFKISWSRKSEWQSQKLSLPNRSDLIDVSGSGKSVMDRWFDKWKRSDISGTSRSVFSAFCDALASGEDPRTGGAPQLVGVYRSGCSKVFGVSYRGEGYFLGERISELDRAREIQWYNELLERCDGETFQRLQDAQVHARPKQLIS